jgi:hypothetical protein
VHLLFAIVRYFPLWALPVGFLSIELGIALKRRGYKAAAICLFLNCVALVSMSGLWIFFRGDRNSDDWVRWLLTS